MKNDTAFLSMILVLMTGITNKLRKELIESFFIHFFKEVYFYGRIMFVLR